ncbi:MAG: LPS export ABC transporter periplasmic protein LptC [Gemmatimonadota bacterium]|nr:LPS export ABC transporter periplasmic protein LptC [Gemmatimonadota bacterium]
MLRLASALLVGTSLAACGAEPSVPTQRDPLAGLAVEQVLYETEHIMTTGGVRKAILRADTAYFRPNDSEVDLRGVELEFFNEQTGVVSGKLTSATGEYDMSTGAMTARGGAVLTLVEGARRIESEELNYDLQADRVWSTLATVMREGDRVVRGTSFESDTRFQNVTVQSANVTGPAPTGGEVRF